MKLRPSCRTLLPDEAKFCKECGKSVPSDRLKCADCGIINSIDSKYCINCGKKNLKSCKPAETEDEMIKDLEELDKL